MGILNRVMAQWSAPPASDDGHWTTMGGGAVVASAAGVVINEKTALSVPTVWACNYILCDTIGQSPIHIYERAGSDGSERQRVTSTLARRLNEQPNDEQTRFEFMREMQQAANFYAYAYAEITWRGDDPVSIVPRHPLRIRKQRVGGRPRYEHLEDDRTTWRPILPENMLRVPGKPVLSHAANTLGQAIALEQYSARLFGRSPRPAVAVKQDKSYDYDDDAKLRIKTAIRNHAGDGQGDVLWMPPGLELAPFGMNNDQAQYAELRSGMVAEVARYWRIPPYMLGLLESGTVSYASVNTQSLDFVVYCLMPWLVGWEQALQRDIIVLKDEQFVEFVTAALMRGTTKERYDVYAVAINNGIMSVNEVRRLENLNPRAGGDQYLAPLNMAPVARHIEAGSPADRLLQALTHDAAGRVLRREQNALAKLAERAGDDARAWEQGVADFYETHTAFVADAMKLPHPVALAYSESQRYHVLSEGPGAAASWTPDRLAQLALTEGLHEVTAA